MGYAYNINFEPIAKTGQVIKIIGNPDTVSSNLYQIEAIKAMPFLKVDLLQLANVTSLAANESITSTIPVNDLEQQENELIQARYMMLDDFYINGFAGPGQSNYYYTFKNVRINMGQESTIHNNSLNLSELFIYGKNYVYIEIENPTSLTLYKARVNFATFKYILSPIKASSSIKISAIVLAGMNISTPTTKNMSEPVSLMEVD
jgi:hypothetical protein